MAKPLDRRRFLTGLGGLALALPFLDRFAGVARAAPSPTGPRRIIVMTYRMGIPGGVWRPTETTGTLGATLPAAVAPLLPWKDRCLFISDIDNTVLAKAPAFVSGHPGKAETLLTGTLTANAFPTTNDNKLSQLITSAIAKDSFRANAASIDHIVGQHLKNGQRFDSIDLAVDGARVRNATSSLESRFFYEGRNQAITLISEPKTAFDKFFATLPSGDPAAEAALRDIRARNKSVLDAVRENFKDVSRGLGAEDRRRLEEHAAKIRAIEVDVTSTNTCVKPAVIASTAGQKMDVIAASQIKLLGQAMACNLAPVGRIEFIGQQSPRFGIPELDAKLDASAPSYDWHSMVHGDAFPGTTKRLRPDGANQTLGYDDLLVKSYAFFVKQFADLMTELDSHPEDGGTVLDHTMLVLASDLGESLGHNHAKMGFILAGNLGGAKRNFHFRASAPGATPLGNFYQRSNFQVIQLLNSIADMAGKTGESVGLQGYLTSEGAPRRIDGVF